MIKRELEVIRIRKGLTQLEVAQKTGIRQKCISDYENGKILPRIDTFAKLKDCYDCTADELLNAFLK